MRASVRASKATYLLYIFVARFMTFHAGFTV